MLVPALLQRLLSSGVSLTGVSIVFFDTTYYIEEVFQDAGGTRLKIRGVYLDDFGGVEEWQDYYGIDRFLVKCPIADIKLQYKALGIRVEVYGE